MIWKLNVKRQAKMCLDGEKIVNMFYGHPFCLIYITTLFLSHLII